MRLEAHAKTLAERIIEREPAGWSGLPGLVEHAQELAGSMRGVAGIALVLSTEDSAPRRWPTAFAPRVRSGPGAATVGHCGREGERCAAGRGAWDAFTRGEIAAATAVLDPEVRWYAAGEPDGHGACHNRQQAVAFMRRALADGLTAELLDVRHAGDRLVVVVDTDAPPEWEPSPAPHGELISVRDGRVTEMVVYPSLDDALAAAGLSADS